jgi:two-component system response regulator HydG
MNGKNSFSQALMENKTSILIVDGDVSLCRTLSFIVRRNGQDVTVAEDGAEAIERVTARPFDLIFIDSKIFLDNGVETYERIKKIRPEAEFVVMMTTRPTQGLVKEVIEQSLWGPLYKPLRAEEVFAVIENSVRFQTASFAPWSAAIQNLYRQAT